MTDCWIDSVLGDVSLGIRSTLEYKFILGRELRRTLTRRLSLPSFSPSSGPVISLILAAVRQVLDTTSPIRPIALDQKSIRSAGVFGGRKEGEGGVPGNPS